MLRRSRHGGGSGAGAGNARAFAIAAVDADGQAAVTPLSGTTPALDVTRTNVGVYRITAARAPKIAFLAHAQNAEDPFSVMQVTPLNSTTWIVSNFNLVGTAQDATFSFFVWEAHALVSVDNRLLLDKLADQPLWAHSIAGMLRAGQTEIALVERADTTQIDLIEFVTDIDTGIVDVAALATWSNGTDVELVNVANASAAGGAKLTAVAGRAKVVIAGVPIVGDNGFLAAQMAGTQGYSRADALGVAADPDLVLAADWNAEGNFADYNAALLSIGNSDAYGPLTPGYARVVLGGWIDAIDNFFTYAAYAGGGTNNVHGYSTNAYAGAGAGWAQFQRASGDLLDGRDTRWNNAADVISLDGGNPDSTITIVAPRSFAWGTGGPPLGTVDGNPPPGLVSNGFAWELAALSGDDQTTLADWQETHRA